MPIQFVLKLQLFALLMFDYIFCIYTWQLYFTIFVNKLLLKLCNDLLNICFNSKKHRKTSGIAPEVFHLDSKS